MPLTDRWTTRADHPLLRVVACRAYRAASSTVDLRAAAGVAAADAAAGAAAAAWPYSFCAVPYHAEPMGV